MTQFGMLRVWAALVAVVGGLGAALAAAGTLVWAFEVDGFWQVLGVLLVGGSVTAFLGALALGVSQALRALADVGEIVAAR